MLTLTGLGNCYERKGNIEFKARDAGVCADQIDDLRCVRGGHCMRRDHAPYQL